MCCCLLLLCWVCLLFVSYFYNFIIIHRAFSFLYLFVVLLLLYSVRFVCNVFLFFTPLSLWVEPFVSCSFFCFVVVAVVVGFVSFLISIVLSLLTKPFVFYSFPLLCCCLFFLRSYGIHLLFMLFLGFLLFFFFQTRCIIIICRFGWGCCVWILYILWLFFESLLLRHFCSDSIDSCIWIVFQFGAFSILIAIWLSSRSVCLLLSLWFRVAYV